MIVIAILLFTIAPIIMIKVALWNLLEAIFRDL